MKKKRIKRELQTLAESHEQLWQAHRGLASHMAVVAVSMRSPEVVPQADLDDAIAGIHELAAKAARKSESTNSRFSDRA